MKIRISNKWNKQTDSYDKALFDINQTDKTISGRFTCKTKKQDKDTGKDIFPSAHMAFTAFKDQIDFETKNCLINDAGKLIEVSGDLAVEMNNEKKGYWRFIIKEARLAEKKEDKKPVQSFHESEANDSEEIPF